MAVSMACLTESLVVLFILINQFYDTNGKLSLAVKNENNLNSWDFK